MQDLGLRAHHVGIARGQRVNHRMGRRPPGLLEVDQRAVFVEEHPEHGHCGLSGTRQTFAAAPRRERRGGPDSAAIHPLNRP